MSEWYNANMLRRYPVREDATNVANDGTELPTNIIADLTLLVPYAESTGVHISSVVCTPYSCSIAFSNTTKTVAVATWIRRLVADYPTIPVVPLISGVSGTVVFGNAPPPATPYHLRFSSSAQSGIEIKAIRVIEASPVIAIAPYTVNNTETRQALSGIVKLEAGSNVIITHSGNTVTISLDAEANEQFTSPRDRSAAENACGKPPIRTVSGVHPNANGVLTLEILA